MSAEYGVVLKNEQTDKGHVTTEKAQKAQLQTISDIRGAASACRRFCETEDRRRDAKLIYGLSLRLRAGYHTR